MDPASLSVSSTALTFQQIIGGTAAPPQTVTVSSNVPAQNYTAAATTANAVNWLSVSPASGDSGTSGILTISVDASQLTPGTYQGTVTVTSPGATNSPAAIGVTFRVDPASINVSSAALSFQQTAGTAAAPPQTVTVSSNVAALSYTAVANSNNAVTWLSALPASGNTGSSGVLTISVDGSQLTPGTYKGTVTVTSPGAANSPAVINVNFTISAATLTVSSTALTFQQISGATVAASQTVTLSSIGQALNYTAEANSNNTVAWLSVSPASGTTATSGVLTISVDGSKLTGGTYQGTVTVTSAGAGNSPAVIGVTFSINQGTLTVSPTTLSFGQVPGGTPPGLQTLTINGSPVALPFTVTFATKDGNSWLFANPSSGTTPATVQVQASAGALPGGVYNGTVTISGAAGVAPVVVPVVFAVTVPVTISGAPSSFAFTYQTGPPPAAQNLEVTSSVAGTPFSVQLQTTGPAGWLSVTPSSGTAPATLSVSADPGTLPAGLYTGTITVTAPGAPTPPPIQVTFTVGTLPSPVLNAIVNAANYTVGGISPGENVVLFGTGIGPPTLALGTVANGAFSTSAGGTRVLFDGVPAPIIYASATQTSVMVPYSVYGHIGTSVVVEVGGVQSSPGGFFVTSAAPGIYTLNQQGTGQGAILNQDGITVNGPATPEKRGNVIAIYMTGEGQTAPAGVDGAIIVGASALKQPVLPVTAYVGGIAADIAYAGSAPGLVSGIMQVNLTIPLGAPTGDSVQVLINVGTASANVVTVAVQ